MISLVRKSSKQLVIETQDLASVENYLINHLKAYKSNLCNVFSKSNEDCTIIYVTDDINKHFLIEENYPVYLLSEDSDEILCNIANDKKNYLIKSIRVAPRPIIFRYFGNLDKIIFSLLKDYEGTIIDIEDAMFNLDLKGSVVAFTEKPLSRNLSITDMNQKAIVIDKPMKELYKNIKLNLLRYLNEGLENKNWYELDIKIYDIYNAYHLHYRRLIHVLDHLELGLVLGENWSRDRGVLLMTVGTYSIKFFTLHDPKYIKKILLGLEISSNNQRICDYDLYYNKKKIRWTEFAQSKSETRMDVALRCRRELMNILPPSSIKYINDIEMEVSKNIKEK